jgi:N-acetylmuramoyl-L-alanine amidase
MKRGTRKLTRIAVTAAVACALLSSGETRTVAQKKQAARAQFETAERLREALTGKPESHRTRRDYQKVIDAYRKVYYTAPSWIRADAAVLAVAELLDEQGRVLNDPKSYGDAIGQLVFLRREYPGSKYRVEALFTIGEIYRDDLKNNVQAKATFEDYLKHYPHTRLAPQARQALVEIGDAEVGGNPFKRKMGRAQGPQALRRESKPKAAWADASPARPAEEKPDRTEAAKAAAAKAADDKAPLTESNADSTAGPQPQALDAALAKLDSQQPHRLAHLTSVRHWSTPDYTRVAIDLEQEVEYQSGRVPHPDRIFFDLHDTRLAADLVGKSFDVEAGFLHRIRVAQFKANMARVVLDVDDVAEYSAFLLPNPYRLIIDIHGKMPAQPVVTAKTERKAAPPVKDSVTKDPAAKDPAIKEKASQPESDVTVTQVRPAAGVKADNAATALDRAEKANAGPIKALEAKPQGLRLAEKSQPVGQKPVQLAKTDVAKADPPKIVADDAMMDEPAKASGKPTTGPTFQSIAPQQSSRNRTKAQPLNASATAGVASTHTAAPTASGERSLIRALGLKIGKIVVDAGHGGHDTGTIGPNGLMEKDLVLDVALKLGKLLESRLGAEVVYTRDDDTFVPLETRTAIANKEQADLFISIHANSSDDSSARGVETYYLNFTSSRDALEVAARENAVSEKSIHELQDLVKKIALKEKIEESREFAADVNRSLYSGLNAKSPGIHNRGVKKAPFIVLIGANMPSILAEISFVSNPTDEKKLKTNDYRQRVAESLYKGIHKYINGLSGVKVASKVEESESARGAAAMASK